MRTRRSHRNQDRLYRSIGQELARAAAAPPPEADPDIYACPDGAACQDPECIAEYQRREAVRRSCVRLPGWNRPGATEQPTGGHLFHIEELLPHGVLRLRRIRRDASISMNPADLAYSTVQEVFHA